MPLHPSRVVEYAQSIPGMSPEDVLFAALNGSNVSGAIERCEFLLAQVRKSPEALPKRSQMLRRLHTMIKLLAVSK